MLGRGRIRLEPVEARRRFRVERFREQIDLPVRCKREDVHELHRPAVERRRRRALLEQLASNLRWDSSDDAKQRVGLFFRVGDAEPRREIGKRLGVGPRFADRLDHRPHELQADRPIALCDVVVLEERRRRQDDVRVPRGVGKNLFVDDREEVVALQTLHDAILIGNRHQRVAVVDEQHLHRRVVVVQQRASEMVHVDDPRRRFGDVIPLRGLDPPGQRVAHGEAAAAHAELAGDRRQREDRGRRAAAVAVALESPAAAHQRGTGAGVQIRELFQDRRVDPGGLRRPRDRPLGRSGAKAIGAARVLVEKRGVGESSLEQVVVDCQRKRQIRSWMRRNVQVGLPRQRRGARIDDHQLRARGAGVLEERNQVNAGRRRVDPPQDDEAGVHVILIGDAGHLPIEAEVRGAGRGGADGPGQPRRAERSKQGRVGRVLREQPVRSAVAVGQDRLGAELAREYPASAGRSGPAPRPSSPG